jgi:hypothetical protein
MGVWAMRSLTKKRERMGLKQIKLPAAPHGDTKKESKYIHRN